MFRIIQPAGDFADGRDHVAAFSPQQVAEDRAIRKASRVDAIVINGVFLSHRGDHCVKEIQIPISDSIGLIFFDMPPRLVSLRIDVNWGIQALRINDNRFRPNSLNAHQMRSALHVAAMAVKREDERMLDGHIRDLNCAKTSASRLSLSTVHLMTSPPEAS